MLGVAVEKRESILPRSDNAEAGAKSGEEFLWRWGFRPFNAAPMSPPLRAPMISLVLLVLQCRTFLPAGPPTRPGILGRRSHSRIGICSCKPGPKIFVRPPKDGFSWVVARERKPIPTPTAGSPGPPPPPPPRRPSQTKDHRGTFVVAVPVDPPPFFFFLLWSQADPFRAGPFNLPTVERRMARPPSSRPR